MESADPLEAYRRGRRRLFYPKTDLPLADDLLRCLRARPAPGDEPGQVALACLEALGERPAEVAPLAASGTFHRLYRAAFRGGRAVVVRVSVLEGLGPDFALLAERWALDRLREQGVPAPRVLALDVSRRAVPFDYEVLEEVAGRSLADFDHDEARIRPLLRDLGRVVARVHAIALRGFGWIDVGPLARPEDGGEIGGAFDSWRDYVLLNLDEHVGACARAGAIDLGEAQRVEGAFRSLDPLLDGVEPVLLHGDLGNQNVLSDGRAISALLDCEDCLAGDPAFDLAFWATFHPEGRHAAFLEGYRSGRALPEDFECRFWLYFLRIALSKTVHRLRFGYADRPGRPPASRRIQQALRRLEAPGMARPAVLSGACR